VEISETNLIAERNQTYNCFGVVQSDTPGQATLCQKPEVCNGELIELQKISDICDKLSWHSLPPSEQAA